jgi:hypothetical protein
VDEQNDELVRLIDIQESQRRLEKRQRSISVAAWIAAICGLIVCLIALAEFGLLFFIFWAGN